MSLLNKTVHFSRWSTREKLAFFQAIRLLASWRLRLRFRKLKKILTSSEPSIPPERHQQEKIPSSQRLSIIFYKADLFVPKTTCLSKSLAGQHFFSRYGHATRMHIGVRKDDQNNLEAHAWLTIDDKVVVGQTDELDSYLEFPSLDFKNPAIFR